MKLEDYSKTLLGQLLIHFRDDRSLGDDVVNLATSLLGTDSVTTKFIVINPVVEWMKLKSKGWTTADIKYSQNDHRVLISEFDKGLIAIVFEHVKNTITLDDGKKLYRVSTIQGEGLDWDHVEAISRMDAKEMTSVEDWYELSPSIHLHVAADLIGLSEEVFDLNVSTLTNGWENLLKEIKDISFVKEDIRMSTPFRAMGVTTILSRPGHPDVMQVRIISSDEHLLKTRRERYRYMQSRMHKLNPKKKYYGKWAFFLKTRDLIKEFFTQDTHDN